LYRRYPDSVRRLARQTEPSYFIQLAVGGLIGAWLFGSLNSLRSAVPTLSHSIAGALAGGIIAVELWKWRRGIRASTGTPFVIPISIGIVIGRWGCLFAGLDDGTFGAPTDLPWAVDLGDGVGRHPVQIYESAAMFLFLLSYFTALRAGRDWPSRIGFHVLIIVYAAQRFVWEFFKPYPPVVSVFNSFHFLMLGLIGYGIYWIIRDTRAETTHTESVLAEPLRAEGGSLPLSQSNDESV
jgi:prolipoprotein diacylglyceryltransferase